MLQMSLDALKERIKNVAHLIQDKDVLRDTLVEATTELYKRRSDCREGNTFCRRVAASIRRVQQKAPSLRWNRRRRFSIVMRHSMLSNAI